MDEEGVRVRWRRKVRGCRVIWWRRMKVRVVEEVVDRRKVGDVEG